jgi:hypothetical protein
LGVVEVCRHGDHGLGDPLAEELSRVLDQLAQHHGRDLLGRIQLVAHLEAGHAVGPRHDVVRHCADLALDLVEAAADEALGRVDRALGVEDRLASGHLADEAFALLGEGDHGRGGALALRVGDDGRVAALHGGDDRVGRAQIYADGLGHG